MSPALTLTDPDGQTVPSQIVESTRYADGGLKTARVAFIARDVPALGYCDLSRRARLEPATLSPIARRGRGGASGSSSRTNSTGSLSTARPGRSPACSSRTATGRSCPGPGNIVAREQDRGDLWELYKGLDGGSRVAMTTQQKVPERGRGGLQRRGKERTRDRDHRAGLFRAAGRAAVRLGASSRRLSGFTPACAESRSRRRLVNQEKFVRYQALFPTTIAEGKSTHEIPFGSIDRPAAIEFPAQNWVDYSDGRRGLALLNIGLPGNLVTDGTMMVSLLRAHTLGAYGFGGGYEPGMSSDSGFQLGQERTMQYALVPHAGDWREAGVFRDGLELNHPLICRNVFRTRAPCPAGGGCWTSPIPTSSSRH